jgi:hypothetical protein
MRFLHRCTLPKTLNLQNTKGSSFGRLLNAYDPGLASSLLREGFMADESIVMNNMPAHNHWSKCPLKTPWKASSLAPLDLSVLSGSTCPCGGHTRSKRLGCLLLMATVTSKNFSKHIESWWLVACLPSGLMGMALPPFCSHVQYLWICCLFDTLIDFMHTLMCSGKVILHWALIAPRNMDSLMLCL